MKFNKKILVIFLVSFFVFCSMGGVFADEVPAMPEIETGTVSGDCDLVSTNPWQTSGELKYTVPSEAKEITSAKVIVNIYSGSGAPTYALYSNTALQTKNGQVELGYEDLQYPDNLAGDECVYSINDHTTKQYSDYQMIYDITNNVKNLSSGDTITINVKSIKNPNKNFDGRIKLIALAFAYNDADNDEITYFLNAGQLWTDDETSSTFNTKTYDSDYSEVILNLITLSSADGTYKFNDQQLLDPLSHTSGNYYITNSWNVTNLFKKGSDSSLSYKFSPSSAWGSIKTNVQLLKINNSNIIDPIDVTINKITPGYKDTVYAGIDNSLRITFTNNNKKSDADNLTVELWAGDVLVATEKIDKINKGSKLKDWRIIDPTIRPLTNKTVLNLGPDSENEFTNYTIVVKDQFGNEVATKFLGNLRIVYNGYQGKDYEYPAHNETITREYEITGDVIVMNQNEDKYISVGDSNRTEVWNVDFDGNLKEVLLYVPYNWDSNQTHAYPPFGIYFNDMNTNLTPISHTTDQGNMGMAWGLMKYGLLVYNVTNYFHKGNNTLFLTRYEKAPAVYPSSLVVLYDSDKVTNTSKKVYISEFTDVLEYDYYGGIGTTVWPGAYTKFNNINIDNLVNAIIYASAGSASKTDANIIFNNKSFIPSNWGNSADSLELFSTNVTNILKNNNTLFFKATEGTVVAYHQILVVERNVFKPVISVKPEYADTIYAGVNNTLTITISNINMDYNGTVKLICDGEIIGSEYVKFTNGTNNTIIFKDSTYRPITEDTTLGNNNKKINYTVVIEDENGNLINENNVSYVLLYNGNLGKDYEYPQMNSTIIRNFNITGDIIILNGNDYYSASITNITDIWDIDSNQLQEALLYISYNWDKTSGSEYPIWNTTFNNVTIKPIGEYRDQSNLGKYGKYGYGLIVYNLTALIKDGKNTFNLNKISGLTAVYPSSLALFYNNDKSRTIKNIYIAENADLLSITNNKNIETGSYTIFDVNLYNPVNSTLYVFAAGAQNNEGNLIINDNKIIDVWNGTSNSINMINTSVSNLSNHNIIYFQSTGSTILALHQILAIENKASNMLIGKDVTLYYKNGTSYYVKLIDGSDKPIKNANISFIINGLTYNKITDDNGVASLKINLNPGTYTITAITSNGSKISNNITVLSILDGNNDLVKYFRNGSQYSIRALDGHGNPIGGVKVTFNINGVFYNKTTNKFGIATLNINLNPGNYSITASYNGLNENNKVEVLPILFANDLVKNYGEKDSFNITALDGQGKPAANQNITFNINGVFYHKVTDANGVARLNINLNPGKYIITSEYNNYKLSNTVSVNK